MSRLPDLVRDTKLDTVIDGRFTVHHFDYSDNEDNAQSASCSERWEWIGQLAQGSFGDVWLQKCEQGQRGPSPDLRAVKIIQLARIGDNMLNYVNELEAIAKFSQKRYSKCFAKLLGWYDDPKSLRLFIAMEYFPLGDLQKYISNNDPMPEADVQEVVHQVLDGLCFMHGEGFAHCDVKPGNILIKTRPPESKWRVKLSDFGISKRFEESAQVQSTIKGTPPYMAPELLLYEPGSSSPINRQLADMWALGEMTFRMLTKTAAFADLHAVFRYLRDPRLFPSQQLDQNRVSPVANSFVRSLLTGDDLRLSADKAREHLWVRPCRGTPAPVSRPRPNVRPRSSGPGPLPASEPSYFGERRPVTSPPLSTQPRNVSTDPWATLDSSSGSQDRTSRLATGSQPDARVSHSSLNSSASVPPRSSSGYLERRPVIPKWKGPRVDTSADSYEVWEEAAERPPNTVPTVSRPQASLADISNTRQCEPHEQPRLCEPTSRDRRMISHVPERSSDAVLPSPRRTESMNAHADWNRRWVITILGSGGCGKSSLLTAFCNRDNPNSMNSRETQVTLTSSIEVDGKDFQLEFWTDINPFGVDLRQFARKTVVDVFLICFAIDSRDSFREAQQLDFSILKRQRLLKVLVGCKSDLRRDNRTIGTIEDLFKGYPGPVTYQEGREACKSMGACKYVECSAKTGQGVRQVFEDAICVAQL